MTQAIPLFGLGSSLLKWENTHFSIRWIKGWGVNGIEPQPKYRLCTRCPAHFLYLCPLCSFPASRFLTNLTLRVQAKERQRELLFKLIEQKAHMHLHCYDKKPFLTQLSQWWGCRLSFAHRCCWVDWDRILKVYIIEYKTTESGHLIKEIKEHSQVYLNKE